MSAPLDRTALDYLQTGKLHPIDEQPKPKWATGPDGRAVDISGDERFDGLFAGWAADACTHGRCAIVRTVNGGGQTIYNWFCRDCGCKLSSNIKGMAAREQKVFDVEIDSLASRSNVYKSQRQEALDALLRAAAERTQPENREAYDDYLRSDRWRKLRDKVLLRARHICEGCLDSPAAHVHHLTYQHIGEEFAFELRALCEACHHRCHNGGS